MSDYRRLIAVSPTHDKRAFASFLIIDIDAIGGVAVSVSALPAPGGPGGVPMLVLLVALGILAAWLVRRRHA